MGSKVFVESLESRTMLSAAIMPLVAGTHPHIVVQGHGLVIAAGDATPSLQDFTNFGATSTSLGALTRKFFIKNTGTAPLSISTLSIAGLAPGDFTITTQPTGDIAPGGRAPVIISFSPLGFGTRSARVVIRSNDPSIPTDRFSIQGMGLAPAIMVQGQPIIQVPAVPATDTTPRVPEYLTPGKAVAIASGDMTPSGQDSTDFGPMSVSSGASTRRYVIRNKGAAPLSISSVSIVGLNAGDFTLTQAPTGDIAPGGKGVVLVSFDPAAAGTRTAKLVIRSNDPAIPVDKFAITGQGLTTTDLGEGLLYATTVAGSGRVARVGDGLIVNYMGFLLNGVVFDPGNAPFTFKIIGGSDTTLMGSIWGFDKGLQGMRPGEHRTLFIPASYGYRANANQSIPPNSTLVFETELRGFGPYVNIVGPNGVRIPSGTSVTPTQPSVSLGTDFGTTTLGQTVTRSFILKTADADVIKLSWPTFTGRQAAQFTFTPGNYDSSLGGWPFTISYNTKLGNANVTVAFGTNDPRTPYTFKLHAQTV